MLTREGDDENGMKKENESIKAERTRRRRRRRRRAEREKHI